MHNNMARLVEATFFLASMLVLASTVTAVAQKQGAATATPPEEPTTTSAPSPPSSSTPRPQSHRQKLRAFLLDGYDRLAHPRMDPNENVTVGIGLAVIHVDLEERTSVLSVDAWMRLKWKDDHLKWDSEEYGGLKTVHFGASEIWRPDIQLYNSASPPAAQGNDSSAFGHTHFVVSSDGSVLWVPPAKLEAYCKVLLRQWPMDSQSCPLKFGSWTSHGEQIDLELYMGLEKAEPHNVYTDNKEWAILDMPAVKRDLFYSCCNESYPEVTFTFNLERKSPAYSALVVAPCLVIMLMTTCGFLLPPGAGEKVVLNGFAFLGCVCYLLFFASTLPFHSGDMPVIVMFYSNTCVLVGLALLLNAACISLARVRRFTGPPKGLKALFSGAAGRILCLGSYSAQTSFTHQRLVLELSDMDLAESERQQDDCGAGGSSGAPAPSISERVSGPSSSDSGSAVMRDWLLVAAGLERLFLILYLLIFAVVLSVYI